MQHEWIAYCGAIPFPTGWSASRRAYGVARTLTGAGYDVVFISTAAQRDEPLKTVCSDDPGKLFCVGIDERPNANAHIAIRALSSLFLAGRRIIEFLDAQSTKPSYVIMYQGYLPHMMRLLSWCRRNNVPLISDVVDWYDARHLPGGTFGLHNLNTKLAMRFAYSRCNGVIVISSYLARYYERCGVKTIRIPTTLDMRGMETYYGPRSDASRISLVYAGSTQMGKDLIGNIIRGVTLVDPHGECFVLRLLGPTREEIASVLDGVVPPFIDFYGVVPQNEVACFVGEADFSVLLREPLLYAQAGFPTKFAESLASCTPVIANLTSDLGMYLVDGEQGFICSDCSPESFADTLRRIMAVSPDQLGAMRRASRAMADRSFDFRNFVEPIGSFIKELKR